MTPISNQRSAVLATTLIGALSCTSVISSIFACIFLSKPALAASSEKTVVFPSQYSSGWIVDIAKDPGLESNVHGNRLAKAQGLVKIPAGKHLKFEPEGQFFLHPECLLKVPPDTFEYIELRFISMDDKEEGLNDKVIPFVLHLKGLKAISLDKTDTTDSAAGKLAALPKLESLSCSSSLVTGKCLKQLQSCKSLRFIRFADISVDEDSLQYLNQLPNLQRLAVSRCRLTKKGLEHISKCTGLTNLAISKNEEIDDSCIPLLLKLRKLTELGLTGTKISMAGLEKLAALKNTNISVPQPFSSYSAKERARIRQLFPRALLDLDVKNTIKMNRESKEFLEQYERPSTRRH